MSKLRQAYEKGFSDAKFAGLSWPPDSYTQKEKEAYADGVAVARGNKELAKKWEGRE